MPITFLASAANPVDNVSLADSGNPAITPPASMLDGDLVVLIVNRRSLSTISLFNTGGQTWSNGTLRQDGSDSTEVFWCRFNGTWAANPAVTTNNGGDVGLPISLLMLVFRPSVGSNTWAIDVAEAFSGAISAPVSPFDITATGRTTVAANTVTIAFFYANGNTTWALQTAGWTNAGTSQYRNPDPVSPQRPITTSAAYKIQTAAGATGNVVNRQSASKNAIWVVNTFKEQSAAVTLASVGDGLIHDGETNVTIAGTGFGASHSGPADIIISPTNNIADGSAVVQTQTSWADTQVKFTANLGSFTGFTNLYVFVKNSSGQSNSSGFIIQREIWMTVSGTLKNLAGVAQINLTNVRYRVNAASINGTLIQSASNGTTDGSGNFTLPTVVLTSGGTPAPGDDVWATMAIDGVSQALSFATCAKITPTYT